MASVSVSCNGKITENRKKVQEIDVLLEKASAQAKLLARDLLFEKEELPRTIDKEGNLVTSKSSWWTSGFFPGTLWYLYEATGDAELLDAAKEYTARIDKEQFNKGDHDVGFMLYCSFGNGYRLTGDAYYKKVLLQGAESLSTRFRKKTGVIRSWDWNTKVWQYPVIIDNMMNLELLEWASKHSDSTKYARIARSHADVTMKNHFRKDYSCYHVVSYDPQTGLPEIKQTRQGFADESAWARGMAWALYGYVMMYRESGSKRFLKQAENIAGFILNHPCFPADKIPYWDFDAPDIPEAKRDASAGAIMASAFVELSTMTRGKLSEEYLSTAEKQIETLSSEQYFAPKGTNGHFILMHSVGSFPENSEVDVPLTYADYYFIETLVRYKKLLEEKR
jgi:Predicted unsaturated glucuronyl hydrolase involved in regulation of bacterial surface properties, and related proteins